MEMKRWDQEEGNEVKEKQEMKRAKGDRREVGGKWRYKKIEREEEKNKLTENREKPEKRAIS